MTAGLKWAPEMRATTATSKAMADAADREARSSRNAQSSSSMPRCAARSAGDSEQPHAHEDEGAEIAPLTMRTSRLGQPTIVTQRVVVDHGTVSAAFGCGVFTAMVLRSVSRGADRRSTAHPATRR